MRKVFLAGVAALFLATGTAHAKPLTPKQLREYKALIGPELNLSKKDALRAVRDPGVKKGEWGWNCDGGEPGRAKGREATAKYKKNVVCE